MQTKIPVSKYWKVSAIILACICVIYSVGLLYFAFLIDEFDTYIIFGSCCLVLIFSISYLIFAMRRMMTDVVVNDNEFQSVFINQKLAVVNKKKTIYYAIFEEIEHTGPVTKRKYILISNTSFKYVPKKTFLGKRILGLYNIRTQILIPYNSDTIKFFDLNKWICVN